MNCPVSLFWESHCHLLQVAVIDCGDEKNNQVGKGVNREKSILNGYYQDREGAVGWPSWLGPYYHDEKSFLSSELIGT